MRMSSLFLRTLRENPADAEVPSHQLLVRAGYIRRVSPGIYTWLPLGLKVLKRVEPIVREEEGKATWAFEPDALAEHIRHLRAGQRVHVDATERRVTGVRLW